MKKKKICFIVSSPITAKAFLLEHIKTLSEEFEVYLIANFENEEQKNISPYLKKVFHVNIERNINLLKDLQALIKLKKILKNEAFDAIHSVTPKAGLLGILAGKLASIKVRIHIFTGQVWHTKKGLMKLVLMKIDKFIFSIATNVLVDGQSQRQFLIENNIIDAKNSTVLGKGSISGVNTEKFLPSKIIKEKYRKELDYKDHDVVFVFLGRLNIDKGVIDLANSFSKLQKEEENVKLLFIGFDEENLLPKIKEIVGERNFKFYGSTNDPQLVLQVSDVLCLPSYREGFGTSVIEGSLLELPIICSDTYGLKETIIDDKTGLRHKVNDVDSIYRQMKKLASNSNLRIEMGKAGREYVLENFRASQISAKWLEYYKQILK
jgi:glycosyltransferase involved in cell wall biosynthesis